MIQYVLHTVQEKQSWWIRPILHALVYGILTNWLIVLFTEAISFWFALALHMRSSTGDILASPK